MKEKRLISYCGICCSLCPGFRAKTCPGCPELEECKIVKCAKDKEIRYCFLCRDFPCNLFEEGFDWDLDKIKALKKIQAWKSHVEAF